MSGAKKSLRTNLSSVELRTASTAEVLLHAAATGEDDPVVGLLSALRTDVEGMTALALAAAPGETIDARTVGGMLAGIGRRLDVVAEMLRRRG